MKRSDGLAIILWLACGAMVCEGQVSSGILFGEIHDPSQAIVIGARVTARQVSTGFSRTAVSSSAGQYSIGDLQPGAYTVTAAQTGFRTMELGPLRIEVNQRARLDIALELGTGNTQLTVNAAAAEVQSAEPSEGFQLPSTQVNSLPLGQRNLLSFFTLGPGAVPRQLGGFGHDIVNDVQAARGAVAWNPPVNGARSTSNTYLLDGVYDTDRTVFVIAASPLVESVEDVRVFSSLAPAEFVQSGGGVVDIATRAGTREFHGSAFEFLRNEATDARSFFDDPALPASLYRQSQYGGSLGGPIIRGSTYFFGAYEGTRNKTAMSSLHRMPDTVIRSGDLSAAPPIFDPLTSDTAAGTRWPFAGNQIPGSRIDPASRKFLDTYEPLPNRAPDSNGNGNYLDSTPNQSNQDHASVRIDHQFGNQGRLFGRYTLNEERNRIAGSFPERPTSERLRAQQAALGYTAGGASWLNEARVAFTRLRVLSVPESAFQTDVLGDLGISGASGDPLYYGLPYFLITDYDTVVDNTTRPQSERNNTWFLSDSFSSTRARHTWKAGFQLLNFQLNYLQSNNPRGQYIFNGSFTNDPKQPDATGEPFADFLLGFPQVTRRSVGSPQAYLRQYDVAGYLQDEWRIHPRLTLTAALRYEYLSPYRETRDSLLNLDYSTLPQAPKLVRTAAPVRPDYNNFAPRAGIAWRLPISEKVPTVFRAGYGIYYSPEIAMESYDLVRNTLRNEENQTNSLLPVLTIRNGFASSASTGFPSYYGVEPGERTPYVQQWSASVQQDLGRGLIAEVAYIGTKANKLGRFRRYNTPLQVETGANLAPRPGDLQSLRTFPELGPIFQRQHTANSIYHSLQLKVEKRYRQRLGLIGSFVWAKSIDDADSPLTGQFDSFGAQDERNLHLERGLSFFDVRKRFSAAVTYDLPAPHTLGFLWRNWRLSAILTMQDGTPLNPVYFGTDIANSGTPNRPNVVPGQTVQLPKGQRTIERYFNTDAFATPAPYTFGNAGRDTIPGPGNELVTFSVARRFQPTERVSTEFRADAFNSFNHPNVGIPGPNPDFGPYFGRILITGEPRRLQFGIRLGF
ncbi:MAG: carboxypeptidase regulatory-like domain-containing protein [Bryobacteraceae bacterium]